MCFGVILPYQLVQNSCQLTVFESPYIQLFLSKRTSAWIYQGATTPTFQLFEINSRDNFSVLMSITLFL